jgi:hypothetical protein
MKRKRFMPFLLVLLVCAVGVSSCKKEKETIATIIIKNDDGDLIPGATVRLYGNGSATEENIGEVRFDTTGVTNGTGKVSFNFTEFYKQGQAGFVVLDIEASKGTLAGEGIIKVEEEETTEEVVDIN